MVRISRNYLYFYWSKGRNKLTYKSDIDHI